jgi:hypothetical protein
MKHGWLGLSLCLFGATGLRAAETPFCSALSDHIHLSFPAGFPASVAAGGSMDLQVVAAISDAPGLEQAMKAAGVTSVDISLALRNDIPGSYRQLLSQARMWGSGQSTEETQHATAVIAANMIGAYGIDAYFVPLAGPNGVQLSDDDFNCQPAFDFSHVAIQVTNALGTDDINPPVASHLALDKGTYKVGDAVVVTFDVADKSALCLATGQTDACPSQLVATLALKPASGGDVIQLWPASTIEVAAPGHYRATFAIQDGTVAGSYRIYELGLSDIYGNNTIFTHVDLAPADQLPVMVAGSR